MLILSLLAYRFHALHFEIEKQFRAAYTIAKFQEFQKELTGNLYFCGVTCVDKNAGSFNLCEVVFFQRRKQGNSFHRPIQQTEL